MATLTGKTLGKYRVVERLGRGGMADVYKAYHPRLDRYVAIKVLHSHLAEGADFLGRFEREARAVATLRHPRIVQVYDFDVENEIYYMVMEFVDGGTLKARLEELARGGEHLPLADAVRIFRQVAEALDHAHRQGMLHRDVKPSNVLLDKADRAFLTDFGIARILSSSGTQFTATGTLIGTPAYMSPEQGRGEELTAASDIYSLGVILYELVAGRVPFDADTPLAVIHKHIHEPLPLPRTFRPELPETLERVVLKALAKDAEDRYQSAAEMLQAVEQATSEVEALVPELPEAGIEARPTEVMEAEPAPDVTAMPTVAMEEPSPRPEEREPEPETVAEEPVATTVAEEVVRPRPAVRKPAAAPSPRRRVKPLYIALGAAGLLVVILGAVFVPGLFGGASCSTVDECRTQASDSMAAGEFGEAVVALDQALDLASGEERALMAELWFQHGEANAAQERFDEAIGDFERCIGLTEGDPALDWLRAEAEAQIGHLRDW